MSRAVDDEQRTKPSARRKKRVQYSEEFVDESYRLALLGLKEPEICKVLGIAATTCERWKKRHPEFKDAITEGRIRADAHVAQSLYRKATGYERDGVYYPPDTKAAHIWLLNRQRGYWQNERVEHKVSGQVAVDHRAVQAAESFLGRVLEHEPAKLEDGSAVADEERPVLPPPVRTESS